MKAYLESIDSIDLSEDFDADFPIGDDFSVLIDVHVSYDPDRFGSELWRIECLSPEMIQWEPNKGWVTGWGKALFSRRYSYASLMRFLKEVVEGPDGTNLEDFAWQIARHLKWEFEDYERSRPLRCKLLSMDLDPSRRRFLHDDPGAFWVPVSVRLSAYDRTYELETIVQSPQWVSDTIEPGELYEGRGSLFIFEYDEKVIELAVEREIDAIGAQTQDELECYISRLGRIVAASD